MHSNKRWFFTAVALCLAPIAAGCGDDDKDDTSSVNEDAQPVLEITSPDDGDEFDKGAEVVLEVASTDAVTGETLGVSQVAWSADGWAGATGNPATVTDLPLGTYDITVVGKSAGQDLTASVEVTINAVPVPYAGNLNAVLTYDYGFGIWTDTCLGTVAFVLQPSGEMTDGMGTCTTTEYPDTPVSFTLEGNATDGNLVGNLVLSYDGEDYKTPYMGTLATDGKATGIFDTTFPIDMMTSFKIAGSWDAQP